jgi:transposase-like protein
MPNNSIPDWKKAAIVAMRSKYGYNAIARKLDLHRNTVKRYSDMDGVIETSGINMEKVQ